MCLSVVVFIENRKAGADVVILDPIINENQIEIECKHTIFLPHRVFLIDIVSVVTWCVTCEAVIVSVIF